ncbi:glycosyltransferase family 2 protein [Cellulomonas marina]|uniref:Glycosyltransferase like family 2 n=1 Tax=Cellulomonas marina TaxID=988821 RepID=A0A1I0X566_9CELL|nr:glycosyltransferase [Cellulomonas marina]GIG28919.1 glycosyl transferase [Cellulomonas marina]SFA95488.1 Glycosyltransferase like family 2 [Cellulomonas marina]
MPEVACVIPTHDRDEMLVDAVTSAATQTRPPDRIVVSDDTGADRCRALVASWEGRWSVPVVWVDASGAGAGTAGASRNAGAAAVPAGPDQVLAFLDDDDVWSPEYLERVVGLLEQEGTDVVVAWTAADRPGFEMARMVPGLRAADVVARNPGFVGSNFVIRRAAFDGIGGFDPALPVSNDKDLLVRALLGGLTYAVVPEVLVTNRVHGDGQLTDKTERRAAAVRRYRDKHRALLSGADRRHLAAQIASIRRVSAPTRSVRLLETARLAALRGTALVEAEVRSRRAERRRAEDDGTR